MKKYLTLIIIFAMLMSLIDARNTRKTKNMFQLLDELKISTWGAIGDPDKNSLIAVGGTGVGKSTLLNLLAGWTLIVADGTDTSYKTYAVNQSQVKQASPIGTSKTSQTSLPMHVSSPQPDHPLDYFDTAGLSDTRMYFNEVINFYGFQTLFRLAQNVKLIIVIDMLGLKQNKLEKTLSELNIADNFTDTVGIVITHVKSNSKGNQQEQLRQILYNKTEEAVRKGIKGAEVIKCALILDHIAFFSTPQRLHKLNRTLQQERRLILKMIDKLDFGYPDQIRKFLNIQHTYILEQKMKETQKQFLRQIIQKISLTKGDEMQKLIKSYAKSQINSRNFLQKIKEFVLEVYKENVGVNYIPFLDYLAMKTKFAFDISSPSSQ